MNKKVEKEFSIFFFQAEDGIRDYKVTGVQTCALPILPAFVRDSLEQDLKNVQGLKHSLDAQRLAALAKRFYDARRIAVLAGDLASVLAEFLDYQITFLGLPIFTATSAGRIMHLARSATKQDLVVAITFRRGL